MSRIGMFLGAISMLTGGPSASASWVQAQEPGTRNLKVEYSDLDLTSPAGRAALQQRVRFAASRLCLDHGFHPLREQIAQRRCLSDTVAAAQPRVEEIVSRRRPANFVSGNYRGPPVR